MPLPELDAEGYLPAGIHGASLSETIAQFGAGSPTRELQANLLREVVEAAIHYPLVKRVLVWGSFVTSKLEPNDLDYSMVVAKMFELESIQERHRRFLDPLSARIYYGLDRTHLVLQDFPVEEFADRLRFLTTTRMARRCGIIEISLRGERRIT